MKKKNLLYIVAFILVIAILAVGVSLAYFTDQKSVQNTFTVGNVEIGLTETEWNADAEHVVLPGSEFNKNPVVTNTGSESAWIRMNVTVSDYDVFAAAVPAGSDLGEIFVGHDGTKWTLAGTPKVDTTANTVTYSYFWNVPLASGASTDALFTSVKIPTYFTPATMYALDDEFTVSVTADAIQELGFTAPAAAFAAFDAQA